MTTTTDTLKNTILGSICIFIGQFLYTTNDAIVKISNLKTTQLLIGRIVIQLSVSVLWWMIKKSSYDVKNWYGDKPYILNVWLYGLSASITMIFLFYGVTRIPIGDAYCILDQYPLFTAFIAWIFLKEKLPKTTPFIAFFGILGIIFLAQPLWLIRAIYPENEENNAESLNIDGVISIIIAMIGTAISAVLVRTMLKSHFIQLNIVVMVQSGFIFLPILLILNQFAIKNETIGSFDADEYIFDFRAIVIMIAIGILGFGALCFNVIGFQYAEATKVVWLEYITIVFTFLYQIFLFNDIPNMLEIIGAFMVIIACCLSLIEEMYNHRKKERYSFVPTTENEDDTEFDNTQ